MTTDWESIVAEHGPMVIRFAMRITGNAEDAEEIAQEVFLETISKTCTRDVRNWGAYLRKLTVFRSLDRKRSRRTTVSLQDDLLLSAELSPHDEAVRRELAEHLRSLITSLPEREGAVFALRYFEQLTNDQIAEVLGVSVGAVAAAMHKVRSKLESALRKSKTGERP